MAKVYNTNGGRVVDFKAVEKNTVSGLQVYFKEDEHGIKKTEYNFMEYFDPSTVVVKKQYVLGDCKEIPTTDYIYYPAGPLTFEDVNENFEKKIYFKIVADNRVFTEFITVRIKPLTKLDIPKVSEDSQNFYYQKGTIYRPKLIYNESLIEIIEEESILSAEEAGIYHIKFKLKNPKEYQWNTGNPFAIIDCTWEIKQTKASINLSDPFNYNKLYKNELTYIIRDGDNLSFRVTYEGLNLEDGIGIEDKIDVKRVYTGEQIIDPITIGYSMAGDNAIKFNCDFSNSKGYKYKGEIFKYEITINKNESINGDKINYNYDGIKFELNLRVYPTWSWEDENNKYIDDVWLDGLSKNLYGPKSYLGNKKTLKLKKNSQLSNFLDTEEIEVVCIYQPDYTKDQITNGLIFQFADAFYAPLTIQYSTLGQQDIKYRKTEFHDNFSKFGDTLYKNYIPDNLKKFFGTIEYRVLPSGFGFDGTNLEQNNENIYNDYFVFPSANNMGLNPRGSISKNDMPTDLDTVIQYNILPEEAKKGYYNVENYDEVYINKDSLKKKKAGSTLNKPVYYLLRSPYNFSISTSLTSEDYDTMSRIFTVITPKGEARILRIIPLGMDEVDYIIYNYTPEEGLVEDFKETEDIKKEGINYCPIFKILNYASMK